MGRIGGIQWAALTLLQSGALAPSELTRAISKNSGRNTPPTVVAKALRALLDRGLVSKAPHSDGRRVSYSLTDAGRSVLASKA
jgi:DNA-binding PadR family transcriptional regulator